MASRMIAPSSEDISPVALKSPKVMVKDCCDVELLVTCTTCFFVSPGADLKYKRLGDNDTL